MKNVNTLSQHLLRASVAGVLIFFCSSTYAATKIFKTDIIRTLVADEGRWGGCMAETSTRLANLGLDCPGQWVTFSCSGEGGETFTTKDIAYRMLDSAQLAMALNKKVWLFVTDQKKHNTYCYANRIDVID